MSKGYSKTKSLISSNTKNILLLFSIYIKKIKYISNSLNNFV